MKIVSLTSENVKRLKAVHIEPGPDGLVIIGGRNGQGKTSVLDSIEYALGGKPDVTVPIRTGEETARTVVTLDSGLVVTRRFTSKGSYLSVDTAEGYQVRSPQRMLDDLVGTLSFDPLAFSKMRARDQRDTLRELVGVDFADIDERRAAIYDKRRDVNARGKALVAEMEAIVVPADPVVAVSVSDLAREFEAANAANTDNQRQRERVASLRRRYADGQREIHALQDRIAQIQRELDDATREAGEFKSRVESEEGALASLVDIDTGPLRTALESAEETNHIARAQDRKANLERQAAEYRERSRDLSAAILECDAEKAARMEAAKFPVDGLAFGDGVVTLHGLPLDQASGAEQLRVSVAMGLATNPKLRVLLIRDGSLLDQDSLRLVAELAQAADAQIWIERVGDGDVGAVIIEDGAVDDAVPA